MDMRSNAQADVRGTAPTSSETNAPGSSTGLFRSFFMGGFECASFRHNDGRRLDLLQSTRHDVHAAQDYLALQRHGIRSVRDGVRWHRIEIAPGYYDWSSFLPMLRAASHTGTQPIWDLFHYGWPDGLDIWSPGFVERFARFAGALAQLVHDETDAQAFYSPMNEISYMAWAAGQMGHFFPGCMERGPEMKRQLVRASIAAIDAIRGVAPDARIVQPEPVFQVHPTRPEDADEAELQRLGQYEAWDMLIGRAAPELGGAPGYLDILGVNYYPYNQWFLNGRTIFLGEPVYRPFRHLVIEAWQRYRRPIFVAETGAEGAQRAPWFTYICDESAAAMNAGVPLEGICMYPVTDYPGWADDRHCDTGLLGYAALDGTREVCTLFADALVAQQLRRLPARAPGRALEFADLRLAP